MIKGARMFKGKCFLYYLGMVGLLFTYGMVLLVGYWLLAPYDDIIQPQQGHMELVKTTYQRGEAMAFRSHTCRTLSAPVHQDVTLVDGVLINLPGSDFTMQKGCLDFVNLSNYVPDKAPYGTYSLRIINHVQVNPVRVIDVEFKTKQFQVERR